MNALCEAISTTKVLDLAQPMRIGMPQSPNHPPFRMTIERRHGDAVRADGSSAANELVITGGHVGTHVDALAHVSCQGLLYDGVEAASLQSHAGFARMGIDEFAPYVGRAVLLDVASVHGVSVLDAGYEITPGDLDAALDAAGTEIRPGEAILIGTGWSRRWMEKQDFIGDVHGVPGPGEAAARWLTRHRPCLVGGESIAFEHIPAGKGHALLPVHRIMLVEQGVHIVETMRLFPLLDENVTDFVLVLNPLPLVGATGAPVRPLALVSA